MHPNTDMMGGGVSDSRTRLVIIYPLCLAQHITNDSAMSVEEASIGTTYPHPLARNRT